MVLPEDTTRPAAATLGLPEEPIGVSSAPTPAPSDDGTLDLIMELAAMKEQLEALQLDHEKLQHKVSDTAHQSEEEIRGAQVL